MQPNHLEITTYIDCPNRCSYCPQELLIKSYKGPKQMSLKTFKKILDNTPSDIDIHFSGFSELFYHPDAVDFIFEASRDHEVVVYTTTRGMSDVQAEQLNGIVFKQFVVHNIGNPKELPFYHDKVTVTQDIKISRGGHLYEYTAPKCCNCINSAEFKQNVVLPNGDVYLCCMDYGLDHKLGNILETNFNDLIRKDSYAICQKCEKCR